jgi:hypothetical protein
MFVLCVLCSKDKMQELGQRSTAKVERKKNPGGGRDFPHPPRPDLGSTQLPMQWVAGFYLGVKRWGRGVIHPPPLL